MFFLFSPITHCHDSPTFRDASSDESSVSDDGGRSSVSFGRVQVKHVHETDQVEWILTCSVDDFELNRMHHARERRKAVESRGSFTLEQILDWSTIDAYKYMAQTHSIGFQRRQRKRQAEEQNLNAHSQLEAHQVQTHSSAHKRSEKVKFRKRSVKAKEPLFWF